MPTRSTTFAITGGRAPRPAELHQIRENLHEFADLFGYIEPIFDDVELAVEAATRLAVNVI